jgi:type II secretory pathway pseudopilin PulG
MAHDRITSTSSARFGAVARDGGGARRRRGREHVGMPASQSHARGHTLIEVVIVLCIIGLVTVPVVHALAYQLDRIAVRSAIAEAAGAVARARDEALTRREPVALRLDQRSATLTLRAGSRPLARYALGHAHGVTLASTRDSIAFDSRGLGYGAANLTLVARRGTAADTLVVSRLGRVRF